CESGSAGSTVPNKLLACFADVRAWLPNIVPWSTICLHALLLSTNSPSLTSGSVKGTAFGSAPGLAGASQAKSESETTAADDCLIGGVLSLMMHEANNSPVGTL